jgi:cytochrome c-type biogenesis protein CcmH/NrfF
MHNLGPATLACKSYFAVQHQNESAPFFVTRLRCPKPSNDSMLLAQAHIEPHRAGVSGPL